MTQRLPLIAAAVVAAGVVVALAVTGYVAVTGASARQEAALLRQQSALAGPAPAAPASARRTTPSRGASRLDVDATWVAGVAARTGIDPTAVRAYGLATLRLTREQPSCRLGWTTLAGIGRVESEHGTIGGATLLPDGTTSRPIVGPALDGRAFAAVPATPDSARLHGDPVWDHAVGPLQFIPSTWGRWASDGDGDGVSDPGSMFDAAYAAGRYLCASGLDLTTGEGWTGAVRSYNHSDEYVAEVLAWANAYAGE